MLFYDSTSKLLPSCEGTTLLADTLLLQALKLPISVLEMKCNVLKELVFQRANKVFLIHFEGWLMEVTYPRTSTPF